jgi:putative membrane protein
MRVVLCTAIGVLLSRAAVGAHDQPAAADPRVLSGWDQATLLGLSVAAVLYWTGSWRLATRGVRHGRAEGAAFAGGWLALFAAVQPWFDGAAIARFSAHMAQHELMMLVGAPLLIAGRPLSTCLWAIPGAWRRPGIRVLQHPLTSAAARTLTAPVFAWVLHGAVVWIWHVPALYELALRSEPVHTIQHVMFVGSSALFWGGLLHGRYGRAGYGAAVFFVFATAVHTGILGALFTLSKTPLYPVYAAVPGMTSDATVADQQIAGLVMWIPAGILLTLVGIALFAAWLGEAERRSQLADPLIDRSAGPCARDNARPA